ncbi:hypothetical protein SK3146_04838 [Paenibacillus konkukensis]|uniref:Uncharacterized protein n=1 Tax=Paenibacillus konkukensis TaxID=2020716 RepID=A0ABY4RUY5_9BACL|nr:hypothetical protein SK3146_04838 [Paenibacillus konkukensis]
MLVLLVVSIGFTIVNVRRPVTRTALIVQSMGVGLGLLLVSCAVAFFSSSDALNILVYWVIYAIAFIIASLVNVVFIVLKKR